MFKCYDISGSGLITVEETRKVLNSIGEKLSDEEVDKMLEESNPFNNGLVDYKRILNKLRIRKPTKKSLNFLSF